MERIANAVWTGDLKAGKGTLTSQSGVLKDTPYSFHTRFEDGAGTNPEELIAAAHAGCFSMALSMTLAGANLTADRIATKATVTMVPVDGAPTITKIHLDLTAKVPGADDDSFQKAAADAKANCPISRLLKAAEITLTATLEA